MIESSFTRSESLTLVICSYLTFIASVAGIIVSVVKEDFMAVSLFAIILTSVTIVKHTYSKKLCRKCNVTSCPFNPKRKLMKNANGFANAEKSTRRGLRKSA